MGSIERKKLEAFNWKIQENHGNSYLEDKRHIVQEAINSILEGKTEKTIVLPEKIEYSNLLNVIKYIFFENQDINKLTPYGITFILNFLKICWTGSYEFVDIVRIRETISEKTMKALIGGGEDWEKKKNITYFWILWLQSVMDKYSIKV